LLCGVVREPPLCAAAGSPVWPSVARPNRAICAGQALADWLAAAGVFLLSGDLAAGSGRRRERHRRWAGTASVRVVLSATCVIFPLARAKLLA